MHVEGIKQPGDKWKRMKKVYDVCKATGVQVPKEVLEYFDYEEPDDKGVTVRIKPEEYKREMIEGFDVHLNKIPKDVEVIRFYCAW